MTKRKEKYCPRCKSTIPMQKAGFALRMGEAGTYKEKQQWKCRVKRCSYITVRPLDDLPSKKKR